MEDNQSSESGNAAQTAAVLTSQLLTNPNVLAAFSQELDTMIGKSSGYIESLPESVQRRVRAMKKLQADLFELESQFYADMHNLECKYSKLYAPLLNRRKDIVNGLLEPTDDECNYGINNDDDDEEEEEEADEQTKSTERVTVNGTKEAVDDSSEHKAASADSQPSDDTNGIPEFWLTIFKNVDELSSLVEEHDEDVLKCLQDVRVHYISTDSVMGFRLEFIFGANAYFTDSVLTKEYEMKYKPDEDEPLGYEGPEIVKCTGCTINWKSGKNVTEKNVKQKTKGHGKKVVKKTVKVKSFFNFFSPPIAKDDEEEDEEIENELSDDYDVGRLLQERIIPRAILYFTGEAVQDAEDSEDDDDDDEEEGDGAADEQEGDEDDDPDYEPPADMKDGPPDCKPQ